MFLGQRLLAVASHTYEEVEDRHVYDVEQPVA